MSRRSRRSRRRRTRSRPGTEAGRERAASPGARPRAPGLRIRDALLTPRAAGEDDRRREYILNVILLGTIGMLAVMGANIARHSFIQGDAYQQLALGPFLAIALFFVGLLALSRRGHFVLASYLFTVAFFVCNSYGAYRWGVKLHASVLGYAVIILTSSILVNSRFGIIVTGAVAAFILPLWHLQYRGVLITQPQTSNASDAVVFAVMYAVIMIVAWLSNREIEASLGRARASESALKEERDLLDIKVEERTRELRQAQLEQVDQLYRFAEFGRLASGLFHDLANIVTATGMRAVNDAPERAYGKDPLDHAIGTHRRLQAFMGAIRRQLDSQDEMESFSLADAAREALQLLAYKARERRVALRFQGQDASYFGSPFRFHQVVINLVQNAIESYPAQGTGTREVAVRLAREGANLLLTVMDRGAGMPAELRERAFEPFFTTKAADGGSGIGLATTRRIVERDLRGSVSFSGTPGGGTTFSVVFPTDREHA